MSVIKIREGCKLALPVGLQELMSDISREVLRAQPENLYRFIANYLEALLNARETLSIACRICGEISTCSCQPQLDDELESIGLSAEDFTKAKNIILDYFDKGQVQESNLLVRLTTKISLNETQLGKLRKAVQRAFQRHILKRKDLQVSFAMVEDSSSEPSMSTVSAISTGSSASDFYKPSHSYSLDITNANDAQIIYPTLKQLDSQSSFPSFNPTVSATTLAGSYVKLPRTVPYSVHTSQCEDVLFKSEKSVLNLLKSFLFAEDWEQHGLLEKEKEGETSDSLESYRTDSDQIDDTIKNVFSQDIHEVQSKMSKDAESRGKFTAILENLQESSSGGS